MFRKEDSAFWETGTALFLDLSAQWLLRFVYFVVIHWTALMNCAFSVCSISIFKTRHHISGIYAISLSIVREVY